MQSFRLAEFGMEDYCDEDDVKKNCVPTDTASDLSGEGIQCANGAISQQLKFTSCVPCPRGEAGQLACASCPQGELWENSS